MATPARPATRAAAARPDVTAPLGGVLGLGVLSAQPTGRCSVLVVVVGRLRPAFIFQKKKGCVLHAMLCAPREVHVELSSDYFKFVSVRGSFQVLFRVGDGEAAPASSRCRRPPASSGRPTAKHIVLASVKSTRPDASPGAGP